MDRPFVEQLHIENYGCIKDATLALTPLHALIGPNDSGKSTVLRALRMLAYLNAPGGGTYDESLLQRAFLVNTAKGEVVVAASTSEQTWRFTCKPGYTLSGSSIKRGQQNPLLAPKETVQFGLQWGHQAHLPPDLKQALAGAQLLRLDPDALRAPHALIQEGRPLRFSDERGTGLPALYDAILTRDLPAFLQLNEQLSRLFPNIKSISLINPTTGTKAMGVKLADGTFVPAELMSEGLLYYLAFAALPHLEPMAILLIEEPEKRRRRSQRRDWRRRTRRQWCASPRTPTSLRCLLMLPLCRSGSSKRRTSCRAGWRSSIARKAAAPPNSDALLEEAPDPASAPKSELVLCPSLRLASAPF